MPLGVARKPERVHLAKGLLLEVGGVAECMAEKIPVDREIRLPKK
jgi:hypothetical protein